LRASLRVHDGAETPSTISLIQASTIAEICTNVWILLIFYAFAASVGSVWLWMTGLKSIPASKAGIFTVMLPISTASVGVLVLDETLTLLQSVAFVICLIGLLLATYSGSLATNDTKGV